MIRLDALLLLLGCATLARPGEGPTVEGAPDFQREVRPLLSRACFACHGPDPDARQADLRLDQRAGATAAREAGTPIVPGDPAASALVRRIASADPHERMPPPDSGRALTAEEARLLERWIAAGAPYAEHWSFVPPRRPALPPVAHAALVRTPIDAFVLARLEAAGLEPAPEADRRTLARRLSLDLCGLPPTREEVARFEADLRPDAYERYVAELLARPAYGERWARVWLDLARYADSAGYGSDPLRTIWRWRDWVIDAFNANLPYDRFTELQMAGDLLPDATVEDRLATAFHRNSMNNTEGGTDDEEFRVAAVKDRVDTTLSVWMGLTARCAQCHSHKYDPLSQEEYYRLFAFFDQTADADTNDEAPRLATPSHAQAAELARLSSELVEARAALEAPLVDEDGRVTRWWAVERERERLWRALVPLAAGGEGEVPLDLAPDGLVRRGPLAPGGDAAETWELELELPGGRWSALRLEAPADARLPGGGPGWSPGNGNFVLSELALELAPTGAPPPRARTVRLSLPGRARTLSLAEVEVRAAGVGRARAGRARQSSTDFGGEAARAIDGGVDGSYESGSVSHTAAQDDPWWELDLGRELAVEALTIHNRTDGDLFRRLDGLAIELLDAAGRSVWRGALGPAAREPVTVRPAEWPRALPFEGASASFEQRDFPASAAIDGRADDGRGWAVAPRQGARQTAVFVLDEPLELASPTRARARLAQRFGGGHVLGAVRLALMEERPAEFGPPRALPAEIAALLDAPGPPGPEARARLARHLATFDPARALERERVARLERAIAQVDVVETPVLVELPSDRARTTHLLRKGSFLDPGPVVTPGVPAALHPWPAGAPLDRRGLARWLIARDNPLTARVAVNRLWAQLFGVGLVETEEDFGNQGALPSHPELLDWLAVELMDGGWDQKALLATIVGSATYRRSSAADERALELDPGNRLLARGPRFRLEAEMVRDQALALAGLLSSERYGPPVFPPQPDGLWRAAFNGQRTWETSRGQDRYRRALYTFWRRTVPYPSLAVFDAPSRETCTPRRFRTNTPLQAFVTLNDPAFVEAAQGLARRILAAGGASDEERARYALELCLVRAPLPEEQAELVQLVADARAHFARVGEEAARALACDPLGPLPAGVDPREAAAWTAGANVLLNLDELLTKG